MTTPIDLRDAFFGEIIPYLRNNADSIIITDDQGAMALDEFRKDYPTRYINFGIAEQSIIDLAAGLALEGLRPFVYGITPFISMRCFEQIYLSAGCMNLPICIIGSGGGFTYSTDGPTHHGLIDLALLRTIPNIAIFNPSDAHSTAVAARECLALKGPSYVRIEKGRVGDLHQSAESFANGFGYIRKGSRQLVITSGLVAHEAFKALQTPGLEHLALMDLVRFKPLDLTLLAAEIAAYEQIIVVEEQSPIGGLHSLVCEVCIGSQLNKSVHRIGPNDKAYFDYGTREYLYEVCGIDSSAISKALLKL